MRYAILGMDGRGRRSSARICWRSLASMKSGSAEAAEGSDEKQRA
jgi:hypothetical protein